MRLPILSPVALTLAALAAPLDAQSCKLACDINQVGTPFSSFPDGARIGTRAPGFLKCGNAWYFVATTTAYGQELWTTDGTPGGTVMVNDIHPGPGSGWISYLTCCNGKVFFRANDGTNGIELWVSDGTPTGTQMVKDINPGPSSSSPLYLECLDNRVVFSANDGTNGYELWVSDGTAAGTTMLKDIAAGSLSSYPGDLVCCNGKVYFRANDGTNGSELWISDGTAAGTTMLKDIRAGSSSSSPSNLVCHGGKVYFRASDGPHGYELWISDGTPAGTRMLKDIRAGGPSGNPYLYHGSTARIGNKLYFAADDGQHGTELWETDGTPAGTKLAADVRPGLLSSKPSDFVAVGTTLFFRATGATSGAELFKFSGGTATLVKDIRAGSLGSFPTNLAALGTNKVVFSANDGTNGYEPWVSDGTAAGTTMLKDLSSGANSSSPSWFTALAPNRVLFTANSSTYGRELFLTAGTSASTTLFKDIQPGNSTQSSTPSSLACAWGNTLYLAADDGKNGYEPWIHDVATGKCSILKDIRAGSSSSYPSWFTPCWTGSKALVFFTANDGMNGHELWVTDGTPAGTKMLKDIRAGSSSSYPSDLVCCNGKVFFRANDGTNGTELWVSDGTPAGTKMLKDIYAGAFSSYPSYLACHDGKLYFSANDGTNGTELWVSDGTPAGTKMLKDIRAGSLSSYPSSLVCHGGTLYFRANDGTNGTELWVSDGTPAGTKMLKDIAAGSSSSSPSGFMSCGATLYFSAYDGINGYELWASDGTPAGTNMVKDIRPGSLSSYPNYLVCCNGKVYFQANDGPHGVELWVSDGTAAGTRMVKDIDSGFGSSSPTALTCVGDRVYFSAFVSSAVGGNGRELWVTDGTPAGTTEVCDIYPGTSSSSPAYLTVCGGTLFFSAYEPIRGRELYVVERPGAAVERLGRGCAPSYPTLDSTPPRLGATAVLTSGRGPSGHVGFLVLGKPVSRPATMPFSAPCALWLDLARGPVLPIGAPSTTPAFTRNLPIPNVPGHDGGKVVLQTLWLDSQTLFPIQASNGVQLTIGK